MLTSQVIELRPTPAQVGQFYWHRAAARIARNDLVALWIAPRSFKTLYVTVQTGAGF